MPVTLKKMATPAIEASFISVEIKRLVAYSGGSLNYDDFAILRESPTGQRYCQADVQSASMPSRVSSSPRFRRRESRIASLAATSFSSEWRSKICLRTSSSRTTPTSLYEIGISGADHQPAFMRVINTPRRGVGDKVS